jgi:hypothetical protein
MIVEIKMAWPIYGPRERIVESRSTAWPSYGRRERVEKVRPLPWSSYWPRKRVVEDKPAFVYALAESGAAIDGRGEQVDGLAELRAVREGLGW